MRIPVVLVALSLVLSLPAVAKNVRSSKAKIEMAKAAKVNLGAALAKASDKGKPIEAELQKKHGKVVWEIEALTADDKLTEVDVDASTGDVVDSEPKK